MKSGINIWAVIVSGVGTTAFGFLWFTMWFVKPYIEGLDKTKAQLDRGPSGPTAITYQVIGNIVMVFVLAWLMQITDNSSVGQGIKLAAILWLGFVAAVIGPTYAFQAFPFSFFLIVTGYTLVALIMSAVVLGLWK